MSETSRKSNSLTGVSTTLHATTDHSRKNVYIKVPIETNNILFLQGSEILKSENSMLEKNQNGADHAITNITMVNNTEFESPFELQLQALRLVQPFRSPNNRDPSFFGSFQ